MTLALVDSLAGGLNYEDIMKRFNMWLYEAKYTPHGEVFDVGIGTNKALEHFKVGISPLDCGGVSERDNGNGSLMRILPIYYYLQSMYGNDFLEKEEPFEIIHNVSALTHAHKRSQIACGIYISIAAELDSGKNIVGAVEAAIWCLLTTKNYKECVLKAVNLGEDTDTTAAVAGGLAGLYYGYESIPKEWLDVIVKREYIEKMCDELSISLIKK